jgi:hypothetical protein
VRDNTLILPEIRAEAERLSRLAVAEGIPMRLMGGLAIWLRSESVRKPPFAREYADIDFAAASKARGSLKAFLERQGYVPEKLFNAIHGAQRLNYAEPDGSWTMDILIDELAMSHRLDLRARLEGSEPTIPLADLLLTKLQIWQINRKDLGDALCLLADHPLGADDDGEIGLARIGSVLGSDWGFCHTAERNLGRIAELWGTEPVPDAHFDVARQVETLLGAIEAAPKTLGWKTRARVGERVRWYETPEEVRH